MPIKALVVPESADNTTIFLSLSFVIRLFTCCILSGLPTEVPPNFMIFIDLLFSMAILGQLVCLAGCWSIFRRANIFLKPEHFNGCNGGFVTLVAVFPSCPVQCLLLGI